MYRASQTETPGRDRGTESEVLISNVGPMPFPVEAKLNATDEAVTLLQTCDWKGHSPSNIGVDRYGKQFIAAFHEVTVTDSRVVPNEQANEIRRGRSRELTAR